MHDASSPSCSAAPAAAPRLSIIVPVFNDAALAYAQLRLLGPLRRCGVEVLAVDGGSTDDTLAVARRHAVRAISVPGPPAMQYNVATAFACGRVLLLVGQGVVLPGFVDQLIEQAMHTSGCEWGRIGLRYSGSAVRCLLARLRSPRTNHRRCGAEYPIFVTRSAFLATGGIPLRADAPFAALAERLEAAQLRATRVDEPAWVRLAPRPPAAAWPRKPVRE